MQKIKMMVINNQTGFTLLEVLIATVILAIGLLGVAALQLTAISGNAFGHKLNEATERIETKIEQYRNTPFDDIVSEPNLPADGEGYTLSSVVTNGVPIADETKTVVVTVSWTDDTTTKDHQISFSTIISK